MSLLKLSKSIIGKAEIVAVTQVLEKEFLGMGPEVLKFEQELEAFFNKDMRVVCVSSGTAALHLALQSLHIRNRRN